MIEEQEGCVVILIAMIVAMLTFFLGIYVGVKTIEEEAVKEGVARYEEIQKPSRDAEFKWIKQ